MSDRYLFRGKRADNMEWVEGFYVKDEFGESLIFTGKCPAHKNYPVSDWECFVVIPETVGQWTGFFDKKKTPIYDSDYLRQRKNKGAKFLVYWDKDGAWRVKSLDKNGFEDNDFLWRWNKNAIVVGNKFNPELLEGA